MSIFHNLLSRMALFASQQKNFASSKANNIDEIIQERTHFQVGIAYVKRIVTTMVLLQRLNALTQIPDRT